MHYQAHSGMTSFLACIYTMVAKFSADCCLDIDWIDDETFTSCGADKLVHIMKVGQPQPIRTLS